MKNLPLLLLGATLLLAPLLAATPDEPLWSSFLCAAVMLAALVNIFIAWKNRPFTPNSGGTRKNISERRVGKGHGNHAPTLAPPALEAKGQSPGRRTLLAFAVLLALALFSIAARLLTQHSAAYLGPMLRGWAVLATSFALFALCRQAGQKGRAPTYALVLVAVVASGVVAAWGLRELAEHLRQIASTSGWHEVIESLRHGKNGIRIFASSTPDYLAAYLLMLLPVTLALFLGAPPAQRTALLFGLLVVMQLAAILMTQSRFALVSLPTALLVFGAGLWQAWRQGLVWDETTRRRLIGLGICALLAGVLVAKPVLNRLTHPEGNSGAFRVWTWRGSLRMVEANPILGTGIGTWVYSYPRYALTGFTRLAHNGYLQMADECGVPALLVLLAILGGVGIAGWRELKEPSDGSSPVPPELGARRPSASWLVAVAPADDRLLRCGLLGGLAGGAVQNLIDSDWSVFFFGATFWALAGLLAGLARPRQAEMKAQNFAQPLLAGTGAVAIGLLLLTFTQGIGAMFAGQAQSLTDLPAAREAYAQAQAWDPLNARYPSDQGFKVLTRLGEVSAAETALRRAIVLAADATHWRRLGMVLEVQGRREEAVAAYQSGLRLDPNSLDLLLSLAQASPPGGQLDVFKRVAALESTPVGTVRAIGDVTEARFAIADKALGDAERAAGHSNAAASYYARAARLLEAYANEKGTNNIERQAMIGGQADPQRDSDMAAFYVQVLQGWISVAPPEQRPLLETRCQTYESKFSDVIKQATQSGKI